MRKVIVWLKCWNCDREWACSANVVREEWGTEIYPDDKEQYCEECGDAGEIMEVEDGREAAADNFYSSMVEERLVG